MRIRINSIEELTQFVKDNFDTLTDSQYRNLIKATLNVYALWKPKNVEMAVHDIMLFWERYGKLDREVERPVFLTQESSHFSFVEFLNTLR